MKRLFNWNVENFKSNFLSRGQPGSKSIDNFFLSVLKMWLSCKYFLGNLIFALTARTLSGNRLNNVTQHLVLKNKYQFSLVHSHGTHELQELSTTFLRSYRIRTFFDGKRPSNLPLFSAVLNKLIHKWRCPNCCVMCRMLRDIILVSCLLKSFVYSDFSSLINHFR